MSSSVEEGLRWCSARMRELQEGATIDAIQIRRKDGSRSWPVHATIRFQDVEQAERAVTDEVTACVEEATETGASVHLRIAVMRGGLPSASKSVFIPAPEKSADTNEEDNTPAGAVAAVVGTNRDLRGLLEVYARQQGQTVAHAMQGWASAMARASELEREAAELRAALVVAEQAQQGDPVVQQALIGLVPQIPALLAQFGGTRQST
jgi:hypothetical protein